MVRASAVVANYTVRVPQHGVVSVALHPARRSEDTVVTRDHFFIEDRRIAGAFGTVLPASAADAVELAMIVYAADRLAPRRLPETPRLTYQWARRFDVEVPVRDPDRWRSSSHATALEDVLSYLTDDTWSFRFVPRVSEAPHAVQRHLFSMPPPRTARVALFSGGLDSLAGAYCSISDSSDALVLVSGQSNGRVGGLQKSQGTALRDIAQELQHVRVPLGFRKRSHGAFDHEESSQRTRGFLFLTLAAATARAANLNEIIAFENGVGAINLRYTDAQLGTHSTRALHPVTLDLMETYFGTVLDDGLRIRLPYLYSTKAELCSQAHLRGLSTLKSVSCDHAGNRRPGNPHCGTCTSCLLRRQAVVVSGAEEFDHDTSYNIDVIERSMPPPADGTLYELYAMDDQAAHIARAVKSADPWRGLCRLYPELEEVSHGVVAQRETNGSVPVALVDLFRRYCREWSIFRRHVPYFHGESE